MARAKSFSPKYRAHVSGNARVTLDGETFYLGKYNSPESWARYHSLLLEYQRNGLTVPESTPRLPDELPEILMRDITADFRSRELPRYKNNSGSLSRLNTVLGLLEKLFGDLPASDFGPLKLRDIRDRLTSSGNSRRYVNEQIRDVIRIIEHGVSLELVDASSVTALKALKPLRKGEAPEPEPRQPASLEAVRATLPHLSEVVADMVRIQVARGCRPSELFSMTPDQVDRNGTDWIYVPAEHKTSRHGKRRQIPIVGDARIVLGKYLAGAPDELCFRTGKGTPWNKDNYRRHITRANKKHGLEHWTPYQLRHTAAQQVRDILGVEKAAALLGHSRLSTTEIYAKANANQAIEAASILPTL